MKKLFSLLAGLAFAFNIAGVSFAATDTVAPSDVNNLVAVAGDGVILLTWDVATDNVGVKGYYVYSGLESVEDEGDEYTFGAQDVGNVISAEVLGLENNTTYYFALTAYDAAGNESSNYSLEVSATPKSGLVLPGDTIAPTVVGAEAFSKIEVDVEFSEKVVLPEDHPEQAFTVETETTFESLEILDAVVLDDEDVEDGKEGKVVRLTTEEQVKDLNYILIATIDVKDLAGNPIISGTSDTASFLGSDKAPEVADTQGPKVDSAEFVDYTNLLVNFNETVVLGLVPTEHFEVKLKGSSPEVKLAVSKVVLGTNTKNSQPNASVSLTVQTMTAGETYVVTVKNLTDKSLNPIQSAFNSAEVTATASPVVDEEPAELVDAEDLVAEVLKEIVDEKEVWKVLLKWTLPGGDVSVAQKIYMSVNGTSYSDGNSFGASTKEHLYGDGELEVGKDYWFKLTQLSEDGRESTGVVKKIRITETGPGIVGLILVSLGLGRLVTRKKD